MESEPEAELSLWRGDEVLGCTRGCPPAPTPRRRVTASYNSLRLELHDVVLQDEGTYVCRAENARGNASAAIAFSAESERRAGGWWRRWGAEGCGGGGGREGEGGGEEVDDCGVMGWVGLDGSLRVVEPRNGLGLGRKGPTGSWGYGMVGLEGSLKVIEPQNGWVGRVLQDHRTMEWLGWKGP